MFYRYTSSPGRILFVSAGLPRPKKTDHPAARKHKYLNYGLLTLASILDANGYSARLIHGEFKNPVLLAHRLAETEPSAQVVLLSLPSYYALPWAREFVRRLKSTVPSVRIVVGGRWVVKQDGAWIRERLPGADLVVYGLAEDRILQIVDPSQWPFLSGTDRSIRHDAAGSFWNLEMDLDYRLVDNFHEYHPSLEVSRGCGKGCSFCEEKDVDLSRLRNPEQLVVSIEKAIEMYRDPALRLYLEASWFAPDASGLRGLPKPTAIMDSGQCGVVRLGSTS